MTNNEIRTRFAPSPTGYVHIGNLRTALYDYLFAKKMNGKFVIRIEDTDQGRLIEDAMEGMLNVMNWTGLIHDEGPFVEDKKVIQRGEYGPYIQSQRLEIYQKYIQELLDKGLAYYCFCSKERLDSVREFQKTQGKVPKYDGVCKNLTKEEVEKKLAAGEKYVIRMKLPENENVAFNDLVRGQITVNTNDIDEQVLMKSDGFPTYHFAVIVDDYLMKITHVIRGEEWLPSTPKHILLFKAFGWEEPKFAHLPNILNSDKKKLSKRQGNVAVEDYIKKGYLKEGLINYIALIGWSPRDNQEIFSLAELEQVFEMERVNNSGGVFDIAKLNWVNGQHIRMADLDYITDLAIPFLVEGGFITNEQVATKREWLKNLVSAVRGNLDYMAQIVEHVGTFFAEELKLENEEAEEIIKLDHVKGLLEVFKTKVEAQEGITEEFSKSVFKEIQKETGIKGKNLFMVIRVAISGQCHGPELYEVMSILGKENIIKRLNQRL